MTDLPFKRRHEDEETGMNRPPSINRLRRSAHFVPGANEKMLHKSIATEADSLILDLEDAVTPDRKDESRQTVAEWLGDVDFQGKRKRFVLTHSIHHGYSIHRNHHEKRT